MEDEIPGQLVLDLLNSGLAEGKHSSIPPFSSATLEKDTRGHRLSLICNPRFPSGISHTFTPALLDELEKVYDVKSIFLKVPYATWRDVIIPMEYSGNIRTWEMETHPKNNYLNSLTLVGRPDLTGWTVKTTGRCLLVCTQAPEKGGNLTSDQDFTSYTFPSKKNTSTYLSAQTAQWKTRVPWSSNPFRIRKDIFDLWGSLQGKKKYRLDVDIPEDLTARLKAVLSQCSLEEVWEGHVGRPAKDKKMTTIRLRVTDSDYPDLVFTRLPRRNNAFDLKDGWKMTFARL